MERIFNAYKIRYDILSPKLIPIRASRKIRSINIYINIDDFFHKLHRPDTDREFQTTGKNVAKQMVANLINLAAHYKRWAIKERLIPNVYLVYTSGKAFRNGITLSGYREYYTRSFDINNPDFFNVNNAINNSYAIFQVISKYIPGVYAIDSNYIEPSVVPYYLSQIKPADFNLLISRDTYDLQYVQFDKWAVIVPKGEYSSLVVSGNLWDYIREKEKINESFHFNPEAFIWLKAILGDKYRSIPKLTRTSWKTVIKYLQEVSSETEGVEILEIQLKKLGNFVLKRKIKDTDFNHNLYCTSVKMQCDALMEIDKAMIHQQLNDMEDTQSLLEANNSIFKEYPLNLGFLLQQTYNGPDAPNDDYFWRK